LPSLSPLACAQPDSGAAAPPAAAPAGAPARRRGGTAGAAALAQPQARASARPILRRGGAPALAMGASPRRESHSPTAATTAAPHWAGAAHAHHGPAPYHGHARGPAPHRTPILLRGRKSVKFSLKLRRPGPAYSSPDEPKARPGWGSPAASPARPPGAAAAAPASPAPSPPATSAAQWAALMHPQRPDQPDLPYARRSPYKGAFRPGADQLLRASANYLSGVPPNVVGIPPDSPEPQPSALPAGLAPAAVRAVAPVAVGAGASPHGPPSPGASTPGAAHGDDLILTQMPRPAAAQGLVGGAEAGPDVQQHPLDLLAPARVQLALQCASSASADARPWVVAGAGLGAGAGASSPSCSPSRGVPSYASGDGFGPGQPRPGAAPVSWGPASPPSWPQQRRQPPPAGRLPAQQQLGFCSPTPPQPPQPPQLGFSFSPTGSRGQHALHPPAAAAGAAPRPGMLTDASGLIRLVSPSRLTYGPSHQAPTAGALGAQPPAGRAAPAAAAVPGPWALAGRGGAWGAAPPPGRASPAPGAAAPIIDTAAPVDEEASFERVHRLLSSINLMAGLMGDGDAPPTGPAQAREGQHVSAGAHASAAAPSSSSAAMTPERARHSLQCYLPASPARTSLLRAAGGVAGTALQLPATGGGAWGSMGREPPSPAQESRRGRGAGGGPARAPAPFPLLLLTSRDREALAEAAAAASEARAEALGVALAARLTVPQAFSALGVRGGGSSSSFVAPAPSGPPGQPASAVRDDDELPECIRWVGLTGGLGWLSACACPQRHAAAVKGPSRAPRALTACPKPPQRHLSTRRHLQAAAAPPCQAQGCPGCGGRAARADGAGVARGAREAARRAGAAATMGADGRCRRAAWVQHWAWLARQVASAARNTRAPPHTCAHVHA
jgi:hypothetical protein